MAQNIYHQLSSEQLLPFAVTLKNAIVAAGYGIPAGTQTALNTAIGALATANDTVETTRAAATSATVDRGNKHKALVGQIAAIAKTLYSNPAVTGPMLATAGLAIHDTGPTPQSPTQPLDLVATPSWDGSVSMKWKRNASPANTTYAIEGSADGSSWEIVYTTTKSKARVTGYTPGVSHRFRVRATKNDISTLPSNEVEIYPSGEEFQLQVAA